MELRELKYFLAVAQEQNITKAAEYLYIAQPSLSKQMQKLEKEIGRPLFIRGSRKITRCCPCLFFFKPAALRAAHQI